MLEAYLKQFFAIDGVTPEEAMHHALIKERNRLRAAACADEAPVAELLLWISGALQLLVNHIQPGPVCEPQGHRAPSVERAAVRHRARRRARAYERDALLPEPRALLTDGRRVSQAARRLGIPTSTAYRGFRQYVEPIDVASGRPPLPRGARRDE